MRWINPLEINGHLQKLIREEGFNDRLPWVRVTPGFDISNRKYQIDLDAMFEILTKTTKETQE